jgi:threonylcarbamoyladenosine tRNA methylthiotransferase MtaB
MPGQSFYIASYGCKLNQYHAILLRQNLISAGYMETFSLEQAQILIISSCVVTLKAEQEVFALIRKWKRVGKTIFAVGCFGFHGSSKLSEEGIFFGTEEEVFHKLNENRPFTFSRLLFDVGQKSRAFVKIQEGCNMFCSYCIVPYTRGRAKSKSRSSILQEIQAMTQHGVKEIVLTGTQIGLYQAEHQTSSDLADLMRSIEKQFSGVLARARLSSIHPNYVTENLIEVVAKSHLWCNHLHLSLQSGSDKVLRAMNRGYTSSQYVDKIQLAKKYIPEVLFTTDIIVGFPGENAEDFQQSCAVAKAVHFSKIHIFPYSARNEAASSKFDQAVHPLEIQSRKKSLLELSKNLSYNLNCTFMGKKVEVLIERDFTGYTRNYKKVCLLKDPDRHPHSLLQVAISRCSEDLLFE